MSNSKDQKIKVFIDGEVICIDHFSGIGHYTAALLKQVDALLDKPEYQHIEITIGAPWHLADRLSRFNFQNYQVRRMPVTPQSANGLKSSGLAPPIDLLFGNQIYVFPNFSSWPTLNSPIIPIIYDLSFLLHPEFAEERNRSFLTKQSHLSAQRATKVITISSNSKRELCENYDLANEQVEILYPIIDKSHFYRRSDEEIKNARAKYGVFGKYLLFVGNIEPRKNLASLLKAYSMLDQKQFADHSLVLVGAKGWKDEEINKTLKQLQKQGAKVVQPTSYVSDEDMPAIISGAEAFVYVSRYEGFGMPPVEAMYCGTPVISSDNSSLPEAVGDAALMVRAESIPDIRNAIEKLLTSQQLRVSLTKKGYEHIKSNMFKSDLVAQKFLSIVQEVHNQRRDHNG